MEIGNGEAVQITYSTATRNRANLWTRDIEKEVI